MENNIQIPRFTRSIQNFLLIWLDLNVSQSPDEEHLDIVSQVRSIVNNINVFSDANKCIDFLYEVKQEKVFMIVSGGFGQHVVPHIHDISKLDSIYVFCGVPSRHEPWAKEWPKVKGVFTQIGPILELLKATTKHCKQELLSPSFVKPTDISAQNFDHLDQSFMYTQILKEILLEIEYNEQSFQDLLAHCREHYANNPIELNIIKDFEETYQQHSPIYWYTHPGFIYSMLNRALRTLQVDTIIKMGFFIQDLYKEIDKLHSKQTKDERDKQSFIVYRGQGLLKEDFEKLLTAKGGLMSFNHFLSTSKKREVSLEFSKNSLNNQSDAIGVLFKMVIDPCELATPYAFIDKDSYFQNEEEEILFSMHTVFRIGEIKQIQKNQQLYQVILTLTNSKNKQLTTLTELLRDEIQGATGWHRLGRFMIKLGKFDKAEKVYKALLDLKPDENERALLHHQLGLIKRNQADYNEALSYYKQALDIYEQTRSSDDLDLATTYNNVGQVYNDMGEYTKALSYYEKCFEIHKQKLPEDHPSLAISYNNIGFVYKNLGEYIRALEFHEKALDIELKTLPLNHPSLATSYNNIGLVYKHMGDYAKALSSHEKALEIEQQTLPVNHPSLAISYNSIGLLYDHLGEYVKALSFYEKALLIYEEILPPTHPDFALTFNNIGSVYKNMGEYTKALSLYKRTLEIEKISLPENHPSLIISYNNIGLVYDSMGEYTQALSSYEKAFEICDKTHPMLPILHNNMGSVRDNMGDYKTALECYRKALDIEQKILPFNHPDLATSYNNIGLIHHKLGNYVEALSSHEKALEIYQKTLPSNHPDLVNSYNNLSLTHQKMHNDAAETRSFYVQTQEIDQLSLNTTLKIIDQIFKNNKKSSKIPAIIKPYVEIKEEIPYDRKYHLKKFRFRLDKIHKKCKQ